MRVCDVDIREGMRVKLHDPCQTKSYVEGEVGEVGVTSFYIWQDYAKGSVGFKLPSSKGYEYSWVVSKASSSTIEILGGNNMKRIWEILVINKETDKIIVREIVIDGDEKSACSKVSISFAEKLKDVLFDNLTYVTKELGSYEGKVKK